ncbi:MFS transporter [Aggregatilineales bacterium SYSU G02658]
MSMSTTRSNDEASLSRRLAQALLLEYRVWRLWPPMMAALLAASMLMVYTVVALAERGISPMIIGLFSALLWTAMLLGTVIANPLMKRFGSARAYKAGLLLSLVALGGFSLSDALPVWFAANAVLGVSVAAHWVVAQMMIVNSVPPEQRGRALSFDQLLGGMSVAAAPLVLTALGMNTPLPLVVSGFLLVTAGVLLFNERDPMAQPQPDTAERLPRRRVWALAAPLLVIALLSGIAENGSNSVLPVYGIGSGLSAEEASLLVTLVGVGNVLIQIPISLLADRLSLRQLRQAMTGAVLLIGIGLWLLPLLPREVTWGLMVLLGAGFGSLYTLAVIQSGRVYPVAQLGDIVAMMASMAIIGAIIGPGVGGFALTLSPRWGLAVSLGTLMLAAGGGLALWSLQRKKG